MPGTQGLAVESYVGSQCGEPPWEGCSLSWIVFVQGGGDLLCSQGQLRVQHVPPKERAVWHSSEHCLSRLHYGSCVAILRALPVQTTLWELCGIPQSIECPGHTMGSK